MNQVATSFIFFCLFSCSVGFILPAARVTSPASVFQTQYSTLRFRVPISLNMNLEEEEKKSQLMASSDEVARKYGLEAGLFQIFKSDKAGKGTEAKELLKRYGAAYLITSISLSLVSITICYLLVENGIDIGSLLAKIGISATSTSEKAGTFAIAYAAHKAASPIRFPPTVALTPVVAKLIGKEVNNGD